MCLHKWICVRLIDFFTWSLVEDPFTRYNLCLLFKKISICFILFFKKKWIENIYYWFSSIYGTMWRFHTWPKKKKKKLTNNIHEIKWRSNKPWVRASRLLLAFKLFLNNQFFNSLAFTSHNACKTSPTLYLLH